MPDSPRYVKLADVKERVALLLSGMEFSEEEMADVLDALNDLDVRDDLQEPAKLHPAADY